MRLLNPFLVLLGLSFFPFFAQAFKMSPMVIFFSPSGKQSTQVLTLENSDSTKVPVQIQAFSRGVNSRGEEVRTPTSDFNIYPDQIVLLPNEKRNIRVTWSGEIKDQEKAYRLIASQLPVEFKDSNIKAKKPGVNLNFLLQYVASAYVTPGPAAASVKVKEVKVLSANKVELVLANEGTAHKVLHPKSVTFVAADGKSILQISTPKEIEGINLLAKTEKSVVLPVKKSLPKDVKAVLELSEIGD
jgi:fimbrial chaperone protein